MTSDMLKTTCNCRITEDEDERFLSIRVFLCISSYFGGWVI